MTSIQQFFMAILPVNWAQDLQAESQTWMLRCTCGYERSIWEMGGIRWKARGNPRQLRVCPQCSQRTWHTIYRKQASNNIQE